MITIIDGSVFWGRLLVKVRLSLEKNFESITCLCYVIVKLR